VDGPQSANCTHKSLRLQGQLWAWQFPPGEQCRYKFNPLDSNCVLQNTSKHKLRHLIQHKLPENLKQEKKINALKVMKATAHDKCGWRNQLRILLVTTIGCNFTVR